MKHIVQRLFAAGSTCRLCFHGRNQHSRNGCGECGCPVKYMDVDMFS